MSRLDSHNDYQANDASERAPSRTCSHQQICWWLRDAHWPATSEELARVAALNASPEAFVRELGDLGEERVLGPVDVSLRLNR